MVAVPLLTPLTKPLLLLTVATELLLLLQMPPVVVDERVVVVPWQMLEAPVMGAMGVKE